MALGSILGWLKSPLLVAAIAVVVLYGAFRTGQNFERRAGEANSLRQQLETVLADKRSAEAAEASSRRMAETLEAEARAYQEELDALRADLAGRPEGDGYPAAGADLDRLYGRP